MAAPSTIVGLQTEGSRAQEFNPGERNPALGARQDYGPNNETLADRRPEIVGALRDMIEKYRTEGIVARRHEIRRIRQARLFWQGLQYGWWDPISGLWQLPFGSSLGLGVQEEADTQAEMPRFQYVTNYFLAYGLNFSAIFGQDVPTVRWWPQSANVPEDVAAAKAASDAAQLIEQNNKIQELLSQAAYYLWTDGKIGGYVRFVVDGGKFGYSSQENYDQDFAQMGEDSYVCPSCRTENPGGGMLAGMMCNECGQPLGPQNFRQADFVPVPRVTGGRKVPNGQEVIEIVGGLELNTPVWAREQKDFPYLQWQLEVHRGKLKAAYPHVRDKLDNQQPSGAEDVYARASRLSVAQGLPFTHPGDTLYSLTTFLRTWIEPWAFDDIQDKAIRDELHQLFPDGCYVAFAGDVYCESRSERMGDHWRVTHAYPGEGQSRPSVGQPMVEIQEQYNTLANIQAENYEFGVPPIYADPQVIDFDALESQTVEPGAHYPARARAGQPLAAGFFQPAPGQVSPDMSRYMQELAGPIAQQVTGVFAAIYGGQMEDVKTASGYAMAREQALGRLGLVWRRFRQFYADVMMLAVDCFRKNRPEDVPIPILGESDEFEERMIRLADLKGNIQAHPEADETYPRQKSQQRAVLQQLMSIDDPFIRSFFTENVGQVKSILGLADFNVPGEDARNKQAREIEQLLQSGPIEPAQMRGAMGTPLALAEPMPTIDADPVLDDHATEYGECKRWASSPAGQQARVQNPAGYANVRAHALKHLAVLQATAAAGPQGGAQGLPTR